MFLILLVISMTWLAVFIASAAFDVWFELTRPAKLTETTFGRLLAAIGISPLILTIGITALVALPITAFWDSFSDAWGEDAAWRDCLTTLEAVYTWFTDWAPNFVRTGKD